MPRDSLIKPKVEAFESEISMIILLQSRLGEFVECGCGDAIIPKVGSKLEAPLRQNIWIELRQEY